MVVNSLVPKFKFLSSPLMPEIKWRHPAENYVCAHYTLCNRYIMALRYTLGSRYFKIHIHQSDVVYVLYTLIYAFGRSLGAYSLLCPFGGSFEKRWPPLQVLRQSAIACVLATLWTAAAPMGITVGDVRRTETHHPSVSLDKSKE